MRERIIRRLGGYTYSDVQNAISMALPVCREHEGCYMLAGHGGPPRKQNGLAFSTNKAKERRARKAQAQEQMLQLGNTGE